MKTFTYILIDSKGFEKIIHSDRYTPIIRIPILPEMNFDKLEIDTPPTIASYEYVEFHIIEQIDSINNSTNVTFKCKEM